MLSLTVSLLLPFAVRRTSSSVGTFKVGLTFKPSWPSNSLVPSTLNASLRALQHSIDRHLQHTMTWRTTFSHSAVSRIDFSQSHLPFNTRVLHHVPGLMARAAKRGEVASKMGFLPSAAVFSLCVCGSSFFPSLQQMDRRILKTSWPLVWSWWIPAFAPYRNLESSTVASVSKLTCISVVVENLHTQSLSVKCYHRIKRPSLGRRRTWVRSSVSK